MRGARAGKRSRCTSSPLTDRVCNNSSNGRDDRSPDATFWSVDVSGPRDIAFDPMGLAGGEADESTIPLYAQCVGSVELMFVEEKFWNFHQSEYPDRSRRGLSQSIHLLTQTMPKIPRWNSDNVQRPCHQRRYPQVALLD